MALFSSGWITFGSANFCSCSKSMQRQTQACSTSTVPMFQCWKSTRAIENQVIFNIFCIFCIFLFIFPPQPGLLIVNLQLSTNAVNKHKFCNNNKFVCDSSLLHTGTPSSCSSGCYRDNTLRHASRNG